MLRFDGQFFRACPTCTGKVHVRQKLCKHCGHAFQRQRGRPTGTTAAAGFNVSMSGGRPTGTTAAAGFNVSDSRPTGTTTAVGFNVSEGRPTGTTSSAGFNVSKGRPTGITAAAGFNVSGVRPVGTTVATGSKVGRSPGRPKGTRTDIGYAAGICGGDPSGTAAQGGGKHGSPVKTQIMATMKREDEGWCTDEEMVNVSTAKLKKLEKLHTTWESHLLEVWKNTL